AGWAGFEEYVRRLYETGSIDEHTQIWGRVRAHLAFPTVEIRICDGQPELAQAQSLAARGHALCARIARASDQGGASPGAPHRWIAKSFRRAIREGLSGELTALDPFGVRPARAELERLIEWVLPVAEELGCASFLAVPTANAAERQIARYEQGATLEEIYA